MSTRIYAMLSPPLKRCFEAALDPVLPSTTRDSGIAIPGPENGSSVQSHATLATVQKSSRESTPLSSVGASPSPQQPTMPPSSATASKPAPVKRQKLTSDQKEVLRIEKQYKEQQKADSQARKEEEKRVKEEQMKAKEEEKRAKEEERKVKEEEREKARKLKEAEKEKKQKAKGEERRKKEEDRKAKENEKAKKERLQMKLNAFFVPKATSTGSVNSSRRSSISSVGDSRSQPRSRTGTEAPEAISESEYSKAFPQFFLHAHTTLAPRSRFECDPEGFDYACRKIDESIENARLGLAGLNTYLESGLKRKLDEALHLPSMKRRRRDATVVLVKELIERINGTTSNRVELEASKASGSKGAFEALSKVPIKFLRYAEDVRPPYIGTYTKTPTDQYAAKLRRNPFVQVLPAVNYDYDSEAEWEEPEEGEELNSEGEEEDDEEDANDMDGFLDDEEAPNGPKRRNVMGEMEPICTGLHWDSVDPKAEREVPYGTSTLDLRGYRIAPLLVEACMPLDPFSTAYWGKLPASSKDAATAAADMGPPRRVPLNAITGANNSALSSGPTASTSEKFSISAAPKSAPTTKTKSGVPVKPLPAELLEDFKRAVEGSDLTKLGLLEVLKKKFPKVTKNTVQDTLAQIARREGKREAEKTWVLHD